MPMLTPAIATQQTQPMGTQMTNSKRVGFLPGLPSVVTFGIRPTEALENAVMNLPASLRKS